MELIVFLVIFIGVPILYLLFMLSWRLNPNHRPRRRNADRELQHRDWHAGWFHGATPAVEAAGLGVVPVDVVDEGRRRGEAVERGVWSLVIVGPQPPSEGAAALGVGAIPPPEAHSSSRVLWNRSTLPLVCGR
jgi:hypothetical protein